MVIEKICDVVKLPITDIRNDDAEGSTFCELANGYEGFHLYIISRDMDEKIEVDNWFMSKLSCKKPYQCKAVLEDGRYDTDIFIFQKDWCSKIIASNDRRLNLPNLPKTFIKEFCEKNGEIESVIVKYESYCARDGRINKVCRSCGKFSFTPALDFEGAIDKYGKRHIEQTIIIKPTQTVWERSEVERLIASFAYQHGIGWDKAIKWINKSF